MRLIHARSRLLVFLIDEKCRIYIAHGTMENGREQFTFVHCRKPLPLGPAKADVLPHANDVCPSTLCQVFVESSMTREKGRGSGFQPLCKNRYSSVD